MTNPINPSPSMNDLHEAQPIALEAPSDSSAPSTAFSFLEWPLDIVLMILEHCPRPTLTNLVQTCKTLHTYSISFLYHDLDLSSKHLDQSNSQSPTDNHKVQQQSAIRYLLRNPEVAKHVKTFKFTLGMFCNARPDRELYRMMCLLDNVEEVDIDGHLSGQYPIIETDLTENMFPKAMSIKLAGNMTYYLLEKILVGWYKRKSGTVEFDINLTAHQMPERPNLSPVSERDVAVRICDYLTCGERMDWQSFCFEELSTLFRNTGVWRG